MSAMTTFDERKFRELILYVSLRSEGDEWFGATKLNKLLFFIDLESLRQLGRTVTGQEYQKKDFGPVPRRMDAALHSLEDLHDLVIRQRHIGGYPQNRPFALREPDLDVFTSAEIALTDRVLARYKGMTASQISNESHDFLGWQVVEMYEKIPFGVGLISERPLTDKEQEYAKELANLPEFARIDAD